MKQQPHRSLHDSFDWVMSCVLIFAVSSAITAVTALIMSLPYSALYFSALSALTLILSLVAPLAAMLCMWLSWSALPACRSFVKSLTTPPQQ